MKNYLHGIITGTILIFVSLVTLILNIVVGPKKGRSFFTGFLRGMGFIKQF